MIMHNLQHVLRFSEAHVAFLQANILRGMNVNSAGICLSLSLRWIRADMQNHTGEGRLRIQTLTNQFGAAIADQAVYSAKQKRVRDDTSYTMNMGRVSHIMLRG
jgi:hypothetical protein